MRVFEKGLSISNLMRSSGKKFILNITTILVLQLNQLYAYVEMVSKACSNILITLKNPLDSPHDTVVLYEINYHPWS